jgi:UDP-N-acetylmuramate dehydrogenase
MLFTNDFNGVILHSKIEGIKIIKETNSEVILKVGSGIVWDDLVDYCVKKNWGGIENLSNIPGCVGAAPVQNIGAYGVEAKDSILEVEAYDIESKETIKFNNNDCEFGYRKSIFKRKEFYDIFITHVTFQLSKNPKLITKYGNISKELKNFEEQNIQTLRAAIIKIRGSKLPSTDEIGNAGSFFKNPIIDRGFYDAISKKHPEMPSFDLDANLVKIPAAWLIEHAGLKGYSNANVGTFENQPLVIINRGNAKGKEIVDFSEEIKQKVYDKFSIQLEAEVCII